MNPRSRNLFNRNRTLDSEVPTIPARLSSVIAGIGVPLVLLYTFFVYRVFKGKVKIGEGY